MYKPRLFFWKEAAMLQIKKTKDWPFKYKSKKKVPILADEGKSYQLYPGCFDKKIQIRFLWSYSISN